MDETQDVGGNILETQNIGYQAQSEIVEHRSYWFYGDLIENDLWVPSSGNYQDLTYENDPKSTMLYKEDTHDDSYLYSSIDLGRYNDYKTIFWVDYLVHIPSDVQELLKNGSEARLRVGADIFFDYSWEDSRECSIFPYYSIKFLDGPSNERFWNKYSGFNKNQWKSVQNSMTISESNLFNEECVRLRVYSHLYTYYHYGFQRSFTIHRQKVNVKYAILERTVVPLHNKNPVEIKPNLAKNYHPIKEFISDPNIELYNDPLFGGNTIDYRLENSLISIAFNSSNVIRILFFSKNIRYGRGFSPPPLVNC